jgi:phage tail-like protein
VAGNSVAFIAPLTARAYDGRGIVCTPDQRIAYWTEKGLRYAVAARVRYATRGQVVSFHLDSGEYQMQWGRLCLDACIPRDADITVRCIASDELLPDNQLITRAPPVNVTSLVIEHDDQSPKLPAAWMLNAVNDEQLLYRRPQGSELPWMQRASDDDFATYEAPVIAEPGRYLWVVFELRGNSIVTPRIRSVRAEFPGHDYLRRLPRTFSTEPDSALFLRRYLAMFAGQLQDMSRRAENRDILLNPAATASDALPWLASFLGMTLDERWSVESRRTVIAEAIDLWKRRGTIKGLSRFVEIVAGVRPIIIEKYRMRGGGMVGNPDAPSTSAILGAGFRVGGAVGVSEEAAPTEDAFETHAHRFTMLLPGALDDADLAMLDDLLELHRPAHTLFDMCSIGAGMRVGRGLHVGISSAIGRTGGFTQLQVGNSALGRGAIVGRPQIGIRPGASRLPSTFGASGDSRVG